MRLRYYSLNGPYAAVPVIDDDHGMKLEGPVPRSSGQWHGWHERPELPMHIAMPKVSIVADNETA